MITQSAYNQLKKHLNRGRTVFGEAVHNVSQMMNLDRERPAELDDEPAVTAELLGLAERARRLEAEIVALGRDTHAAVERFSRVREVRAGRSFVLRVSGWSEHRNVGGRTVGGEAPGR